jgi:hypothetical protein
LATSIAIASVANRLPAQTIDQANHYDERRADTMNAANLDVARQAIPPPKKNQ